VEHSNAGGQRGDGVGFVCGGDGSRKSAVGIISSEDENENEGE